MENNFDLQAYLTKGVERVVADSLKATLKNPRESLFMAKFAAHSVKASRKRAEAEKGGLHVPPFLIASITSSCNLHCAGCYSRCNAATTDEAPAKQLTRGDWERIFREADELGISFILLAGGEPMLRRDVITIAGEFESIIFPVFTNGTFLDDKYLELFDRCRNLIPVMSIEGGKEATDSRRGEGIYDKLISNMDRLFAEELLFGASVTVTKENLREVTSETFIKSLADRGCRLIVYVEFVPVTEEASELAPEDSEREYLKAVTVENREAFPEMVFLSFPGDEKSSGGCIAAGRGFFHINSQGGAEPCPFSPYSDINVRDTSLKEALDSELFVSIREGDILNDDHAGGCVLYEKRDQIELLMRRIAGRRERN